LSVTVVRPGVIWGTGDITIIPRFAALLRRGMMVYSGGGQNLIALSHVRNLAAGVILAAQTATAGGQIYHVTDGEELTSRQALVSLAQAMGVAPPRLSVPYWVVYGIGTIMELAAKAIDRVEPPAITRYAVRLVSCHCRYNIEKARSDLGYVPLVTFRKGIAELALDPKLGFPHSRITKGV
jgi:nucleoside-diphosphate-sugar epimerase